MTTDKLNKANELKNFGICTNENIEISLQDLREVGFCDIMILTKKNPTANNCRIIFDKNRKKCIRRGCYS